MSDEPRAWTKEEVRSDLLGQIQMYVHYWDTLKDDASVRSQRDRLGGLAFSILGIFDGVTDLPAFDIVCSPHPDDEAFHKDEGDNWYPTGLVINDDVHLHDLFVDMEKPVGPRWPSV